MLDYSLAHWLAFLATAVVLNLSPGPDIAFILGNTVKSGRKKGMAAMFGIWTGAFGHVLFAVAGLSAILATSAWAFGIVKWLGVAYLVWLAIQALRSSGTGMDLDMRDAASQTTRMVFLQGVLVDLLNPKVAIFFLAFLPQFVVEGAGPVWLQLLFHGTLIIVVAAIVEPPLVYLGDRLTRRLRSSNKLQMWLDRVMGTMLLALAGKLAFTQR